MRRIKWPTKFPFKILRKSSNQQDEIKKISKKTIVVSVLLLFLICSNGIFWYYRATHGNFKQGEKQQEWEIDLNKIALDDKKPETSKKTVGKYSEKGQAQVVSENGESTDKQTASLNTNTTTSLKDKALESENDKKTSASVKPVLTTMTVPTLGKVTTAFAQDKLVYSKTLEQWSTHNGIDIATELGKPVKAVMDGKIEEVKTNDHKLGVVVVIDHGAGIKTVYGNLSSDNLVKKGKSVVKGQIIGAVGNTAPYEIEEPPHLHFELMENGKQVDPYKYLPKVN